MTTKKKIASAITLLMFGYALSSIGQNKPRPTANTAAAFINFDNRKVDTTNMEAYLNGLLNDAEHEKYIRVSAERDGHNGWHQRYQQHYNNFPVEHGMYMVHSKSGIITSINGEYVAVKNKVKLLKNISKEQAFEHAKVYLAKQENANAQPAFTLLKDEMWIIKANKSDTKDEYVLVFSLVIPPYKVQVDAGTGEVVRISGTSSSANATGTVVTRFSGTQTVTNQQFPGPHYMLIDSSRTSGSIHVKDAQHMHPGYISTGGDFADPNENNNWSEFYMNANKDDAASDVFWGLQKTYDYYVSVHNRYSYNNASNGHGAGISAFVHSNTNYDNADWNFATNVLSFGDGDPNVGQPNPVTTLDVVGHEFSHGVTANTAYLNDANQAEPGALSEGFSDIFGGCVENYVNGLGILPAQKNIWLDGSELKPSGYRNIQNPSLNNQPDTYHGFNWQTVSGNDFIHRNSTVLSHWFYLLAQGSAGEDGINDNLETYTVTGLGFSVAEQIAYQSLFFLKTNSGYFEARAASVIAAGNLYGANEVTQVLKAWHAVGVGSPDCYATGKIVPASLKYISSVVVNSTTKNSLYNPCGYFSESATGAAIIMTAGATQTLSVASDIAEPRYWAVYIDFNNNKSFGDIGEVVLLSYTTNPTVTFPVSVGANVAGGYTYMRVMMSSMPFGNNSCQLLADGEVEDYKVNIIGPACSAPVNVSLTSVNPSSAVAAWSSAQYASSYSVELYAGGVWNSATLVAAPATSLSITGLTANTPYKIRVNTGCAYGSASAVPTIATFTTPVCPAAAGLGTTAVTTTSAVLQWSPASFAVSYSVSIFVNGVWTFTGTVNAPTTSLAVTGLMPGTMYQFNVKSNCQYGSVSALSSNFLFSTLPLCSADASEPNDAQNVAYTIPVSAFSAGAGVRTATLNGLICHNYPQTGGGTGDVDWFTFTNQNFILFSNPLSGYPDVWITLTNLPADYDIVLYNSANVAIKTSSLSGTNSETMVFHPCFGATDTYYIKVFGFNGNFNLTQNYKLSVTLKAISYTCPGARGIAVDTLMATGINNLYENADALRVFPNPGSGKFNITGSVNINSLTLMDLDGKIIRSYPFKTPVKEFELDITELPAGLYMLNAKGDFGSVNKKVIKN